jgi:hypothetical protein
MREIEKISSNPLATVAKEKSPELLAGIQGIELTAVSLKLSRRTTLDDVKLFSERLGARVRSYQWWLGDICHQGEMCFGEIFHQVGDATGLSYEYLNKVKSVAAKVAPKERRPSLPFSFHFIVSPLLPKEQKTFLDMAERHAMTREELAAEVRKFKQGIEAPKAAEDEPQRLFDNSRDDSGGGFYHNPDEDFDPLSEFDLKDVTEKVLELLEPASETEVRQIVAAIQRRFFPEKKSLAETEDGREAVAK